MKTKMIFLPAALLMLGFAACSDKNANCDNTHRHGDKIEVYTGILPAADAAGIQYTLHLDYDDDKNFTDGDYDLYETYLTSDTTTVAGVKNLKTFRTEGDFTVQTGLPSDPNAKYIKLVPDMKDSGPGASSEPMYFAVTSNSTLLMLNSQLEAPADTLNYTLRM